MVAEGQCDAEITATSAALDSAKAAFKSFWTGSIASLNTALQYSNLELTTCKCKSQTPIVNTPNLTSAISDITENLQKSASGIGTTNGNSQAVKGGAKFAADSMAKIDSITKSIELGLVYPVGSKILSGPTTGVIALSGDSIKFGVANSDSSVGISVGGGIKSTGAQTNPTSPTTGNPNLNPSGNTGITLGTTQGGIPFSAGPLNLYVVIGVYYTTQISSNSQFYIGGTPTSVNTGINYKFQ